MNPNPPSAPATDAGSDNDVRGPAERDEKPGPPHDDGQHRENRKPIEQAHTDVESGLQDTERIGTPSTVPSSGQNR